MAYIANMTEVKKKVGNFVGESQHCVAAVKALAGAPQTGSWKRGTLVKGDNTIKEGTAIATFTDKGAYKGHAAIYVKQDNAGIHVYDQWLGRKFNTRVIKFNNPGYISNDGDQYYVIE